MKAPVVLEWIVDTRHHFPEATETRHLESVAASYLSLLSASERTSALKYVFPRDAKLSLASSLLKRYAICQALPSLPWPAAETTRDAQGKPIFRDADGGQPLAFNVSHQDGLAVLFGVSGYRNGVEVGVDVVSCTERRARDEEAIRTSGWAQFVDVYDSVFSPGELDYLKGLAGKGVGVSERLRYFYALWCLKEAYIKMTGEALLADWLQALEFRNFLPPHPGEEREKVGGRDMTFGGVITEVEVFRDGRRDVDVKMELRALGKCYMIGTAVRTAGGVSDASVSALKIGEYRMVGLEEIRAFAETGSL